MNENLSNSLYQKAKLVSTFQPVFNAADENPLRENIFHRNQKSETVFFPNTHTKKQITVKIKNKTIIFHKF